MQVQITGRQIDLTAAIEAYAEKKIKKLERYFPNIIRAEVIVGRENKHHQKGDVFYAECKLIVPGNDLFARKTEQALYKAIDKVSDYLEGEAKKHKAKLRGSEKKKRNTVRNSKEYRA